jgi:DNA-nicking Smr family endonuclease
MDKKDFLDEEDKELWLMASSDFEPLKNKNPAKFVQQTQKIDKVKKITEIKATTITPCKQPIIAQSTKSEFLEIGDMRQVDGSIAKKLKEGSYPIDVRLDLHGCNQDEAFLALNNCISNAYNLGKRCVLVITGKGVHGKGVLREQLPKWLAGLQEYILAINPATSQNGGSGAFYVLLRRNKFKKWF